jgi:hypothetical protein
MKSPALMLTFDTEEFDLPTEFGFEQKEDEQFDFSLRGTDKVLEILSKYKLSGTFFVTEHFAIHHRDLIKTIAESHEIAIHGALHSDNYHEMDGSVAERKLTRAKASVERIIGKPTFGFRAPRFEAPSFNVIRKAGFNYDSSLHPTYVPGRYNHFFAPRVPYTRGKIVVAPVSVSPLLRAPFSWIWFRTLPLSYSLFHSKLALLSTQFLHLYFHPWEFVSLSSYKKRLPSHIIYNTGLQLQQKLEAYIKWCKLQRCRGMTVYDYLCSKNLIR